MNKAVVSLRRHKISAPCQFREEGMNTLSFVLTLILKKSLTLSGVLVTKLN